MRNMGLQDVIRGKSAVTAIRDKVAPFPLDSVTRYDKTVL